MCWERVQKDCGDTRNCCVAYSFITANIADELEDDY